MARTKLKFVGSCRTPEYGAEDHVAYVAKVTPYLLDDIVKAQAMLGEIEDSHCLEIWDYSLKVYSRIPDLKGLVPVEDVAEELEAQEPYDDTADDEADFDSDRDGVQIDCPALKITGTDFLWAWYPRHSSGECSTHRFTVEQCRKLMVAK